MVHRPSNHWDRLEPLLDGAADLPPAERKPWLRAQTDDEILIREVLDILAAGETHDDFLDPATGPAPEAPLPGPGDHVGRWELLRELGRGGMGVVHLARHAGDGYEQLGVVKFPVSAQRGRSGRERFRRERHVLARLRHPNIAGLLDGGVLESDHPYCVLEYVDGIPLDRYVADRELDAKAVVRLFLQLLDAVEYAHQNLVLHRDIKPSNVVVDENGHVKLLDFGIAKLLDHEDLGELTQTWPAPHTPRYASPEQVQGGVITTASDTYQLGVLLYDLLCGPSARSRTTDGKGATTTTISIVPTRVQGVRRGVSKDLDRIVLSAADPDPQRRYASVTELAADLRRWLDDLPVQVRASSAGYRFGLFLRRNRAAVSVASVALLTLLGFGTLAVLQLRAEKQEAERRAAENAELVEFLSGVFEAADPDAGGDPSSVRELVRASLRRIDEELSDQPDARARLLMAAARVAQNVGLEQEAEDVFREVVEFHRSHPDGVRNPAYHTALREYARELVEQQEYRDGVDLYRELIDALEASGVGEGAEAALAWLRRASALALLRENEEALAALETGRRLARANDLTVDAESHLTWARLLSQADRLQEAEEAFRSVLEDAPSAAAHQSYAVLLDRLQRGPEALHQLRTSLALSTRESGATHHNTLLLRSYLARSLMRNGHADAAIDTLRASIPLARQAFGNTHWRVGSVLSALGLALADAGRPEEATRELYQAWRHQAAALGEEHTWTLCAAFRHRASILAQAPNQEHLDRFQELVDEMVRRTREDEDGLDRAVSIRSLENAAQLCRELGEVALASRIESLIPGRAARVVESAEAGE